MLIAGTQLIPQTICEHGKCIICVILRAMILIPFQATEMRENSNVVWPKISK